MRLGGDRLFYGLYLNELVYYLLEAHTPFPEVFDAYARAIMALADGETPELPLRRFEFLLLQALGYAVDFEYAADDDSPIDPTLLYGFERELGFVACERAPDPVPCSSVPTCWPSPKGVSTRLPCCRRPSVSAGWRCSPISASVN